MYGSVLVSGVYFKCREENDHMSKISMLNHIKTIPELMKMRMNEQDDIDYVLKNVYQKDSIAIIASGSSYNAAHEIKLFAEKIFNIHVELYYPNYFLRNYGEKNIDVDKLYLFISQGGKTKSVLEAIKWIHRKGGITVSITEKLDSPIAQTAKFNLEIGSKNEPYIFRTSGFSLTVYTLFIFIIKFAYCKEIIDKEMRNTYLAQLSELPNSVNQIITIAEQDYAEDYEKISNYQAVFVSGAGNLWPIAREVDIKFMEMLPIISNSFELEEIIHGPQNCFTSEMLFFFLVDEQQDYQKATSIQNFIQKEIGAFCKIISPFEKKYAFLDVENPFNPLLFITYFQVICYFFSQSKGRDLTKRIYPQIDNYIKKSVILSKKEEE